MPNTLHIPWLDDLSRNLSAPQRKSMLIALTQDLRRSNQARIRDQVNTDGSSYAPRKQKIRAKKGRIKRRAMFAKIRTNRYMRIRSTSDQGRVFIAGQAGHIAKAHNFGLYSTVEKGKPWKTQYPQRELLGISDKDMRQIEATAMRYIADGLL